MKKLESLNKKKFKPLSKDALGIVNGGWTVIYANQYMASATGSNTGQTGEYGYPSIIGVRTGRNGWRNTDTYTETASI